MRRPHSLNTQPVIFFQGNQDGVADSI